MQTETVLLIILAALVALLVSLFQYYFRNKRRDKLHVTLSFLRFLGVFGILLLLINPQILKTTYKIEKPVLAVLVDNSTSAATSKEEIESILSALKNSETITDRFTVSNYVFGKTLRPLDSLTFADELTNIDNSISSINEAYRRKESTILLISDGNQTVGKDYIFNLDTKKPIYTVTIGDTTAYEDLSIGAINSNRYAFLNNKFPLESYVTYQGNGNVSGRVNITLDGKNIFSQAISLSKSNNLASINTLIDANSVGNKTIKVSVTKLASERNISNNTRQTTVEVIDEKTNVAIVSQILHPDLGAFKKAIESNEQRQVQFISSNTTSQILDDMDLFILYEPDRSFKSIIEYIQSKKSNYLMVTGVNTDFGFLNQVQENFIFELGYPEQEVFGSLNSAFSKYDITDFDMSNFPPLSSDAGPLLLNTSNDILLDSEIKGVNINSPLLSVFEDNSWKRGLWVGSGIWKWRGQTYRNSGDFSNFDLFMGKLVRYLTSNARRERLNLEYNSLIEGSNSAVVTATYFDEAYVFEPNATLDITIRSIADVKESTRPMVLRNGYYEADLSDLSPGSYEFRVNVAGGNISKSGNFVISEFDLEKQFVSSNYQKMNLLSSYTKGTSFLPSQVNQIIDELSSNDAFVPTQKSIENIVSLVDYRMLLAIIVLAFTIEWFLRKYNGLI